MFAAVLVLSVASAGSPADLAIAPPSLLVPLVVGWPAAADPATGPVIVELDLLVSELGEVLEVLVLRGDSPFVDVATRAALSARLSPATEGGVAVVVHIPLTITFTPPPVSIAGRVRLSGGGSQPLGGATVRVDGRDVATDTAGRFSLRGVPPGAYTLTVRAPGVRIDDVELVVVAGAVVEVELWAAVEGVDSGIVGTYRRGRAEVSRRSVDSAELRAMPGSLGDPLRAVVNLPGTVRSPLESGWLLVRGGDPTHTAVYVDGVRVPLVYHLGGFTSVFHPAFVARVDFLPSGGGVRYGRGLAGTVDVVTRAPSAAPEVRAGANLVFAGAYASAPVGRARVSGSVRRSYLDGVASPFLPADAAGSIPQFWDWQARLDIDDDGVFGFGFADVITLPLPDATAVYELGTERVHARLRTPLGSRTLLIAPSFAWERQSLVIDAGASVIRQERTGGGLRVELEDDGSSVIDGRAGVDVEAFGAVVRYDGIERAAPVVMPDVYADLRIGNAAQVVAGLRLESLLVGEQGGRTGLSPGVAGLLPLGARAGLELELSGHHAPPAWELLLAVPEGASMELDQSWGGSAGAFWGAGAVDLSVEAYGRLMPVLAEIEADRSIDVGQGLAYGAELAVRASEGRLSGSARLAWGRSFRREDSDAPWAPSRFDQPVTAGIAGEVDLGRAWTVAGRFRYASGYLVETDPQLVVDALTLEVVEVEPFGRRAEDFYALDLKVSKRFSFRTWRLDAYLDLQNVTNHRVPEPFITGLVDVAVEGMGFGLPILPIFGVEGAWGGDPRRP